MMARCVILAIFCIGFIVAAGWLQSEFPLGQRPVIEVPLTERIGDVDHTPMVLIPAGEFQMGSERGDSDEKPVHKTYVDAFYMDKYEVTNEMYKKFTRATGHPPPDSWKNSEINHPTQPVVGVGWNDAMAYARWSGKRLPTEAEWEKAARAGSIGKRYAWGDDVSPPKGAGNFADEFAKKKYTLWQIFEGYDDGYLYPAPVGSFSANSYGLYDMAGNVWEWCLDRYDVGFYAESPQKNPIAGKETLYEAVESDTSVEDKRVVRGGSWVDSMFSLRTADRGREYPTATSILVGFRCVLPAAIP